MADWATGPKNRNQNAADSELVFCSTEAARETGQMIKECGKGWEYRHGCEIRCGRG
jgi:hypothetical protein